MTDEQLRGLARSCLSKNAYPTLWKAKQVAADAYRKRGVKLYVYSCPECGLVHLTKNPYGNSRLEYKAYRKERTLWEKEHEEMLALGA